VFPVLSPGDKTLSLLSSHRPAARQVDRGLPPRLFPRHVGAVDGAWRRRAQSARPGARFALLSSGGRHFTYPVRSASVGQLLRGASGRFQVASRRDAPQRRRDAPQGCSAGRGDRVPPAPAESPGQRRGARLGPPRPARLLRLHVVPRAPRRGAVRARGTSAPPCPVRAPAPRGVGAPAPRLGLLARAAGVAGFPGRRAARRHGEVGCWGQLERGRRQCGRPRRGRPQAGRRRGQGRAPRCRPQKAGVEYQRRRPQGRRRKQQQARRRQSRETKRSAANQHAGPQGQRQGSVLHWYRLRQRGCERQRIFDAEPLGRRAGSDSSAHHGQDYH
jgi:hypothetical protein